MDGYVNKVLHGSQIFQGSKKPASNAKVTSNPGKAVEKPPVKKWTEQDEAAKKIQTVVRGFLGRRALKKLKQEKEDYEDLMDKLEREVDKLKREVDNLEREVDKLEKEVDNLARER